MSDNSRGTMRKRLIPDEQGSLFEAGGTGPPPRRKKEDKPDAGQSAWRMPDVGGRTAAEIRVEWRKRLSPGQVNRVEAELNALVARFNKLGFGTVHVARSFVRRRKDSKDAG